MSDGTRAAPQLTFDDGSRIMMEEAASEAPAVTASPRGTVSIKEYYEVDRLVQEIQKLDITRSLSSPGDITIDGWSVRVALQLPDNLLVDAADVSWEFETALSDADSQALVFVLGDTTFAPCCIDAVAAQHLQADCVVHYGHACLSPCRDIPVFYSFGRQELSPTACVEAVVQEIATVNQQKEEKEKGDSVLPVQRVLVLYQVCYHHHMEELETLLKEQGSFEQVIMGKIPSPEKRAAAVPGATSGCGKPDCCSNDNDEKSVPAETTDEMSDMGTTTPLETAQDSESEELPMIELTAESFVVGGLEIPKGSDWSSFTLLYIGDETCRQYLNIVLRMLSGSGPARYWTWRPESSTLSTDLSPAFQRRFSRRYYLVQKARQANVVGILVASLTDTYMRTVVASLRKIIQKHDRTAYTMVVGKINPSKLANFGEIDCFCMVACPEHSLLDDDREYHVPVLTPLELAMALGDAEWGVTQYSLDIQDYLQAAAAVPAVTTGDNDNQEEEDVDADAPYFSLVTGRYESKAPAQTEDTDLTALPGKGQVAQYHSAAAAHLKQREYQGLQVLEGKTEVHAASQGDKGIASNYGDR
jgi:diphthamide biosynthesis protein 2